MTKIKKLDWSGWLYGLVAGVIGGVATAILANPVGQIFGALQFTLRQLGAVAVGAAIVSAAAYLKKSPLPEVIEEEK
jgi:predicted lipid-binding transport protein (Tim44 family)